MRFWIFLLLILYVLSPFDLLPEALVGPIGWLEDAITVGLLYWYFIYRPAKMRSQFKQSYYGKGEGASGEAHQENQQRGQTGAEFSRQDPYDVLGVPRGASQDEIRRAYRKLVVKYHPDKVNHLGDEFRILAEKRFKEIQRAYQELIKT
ncbi:MAG: DnaJ domain-containing protein [Deltaproteobacteria bacterium]|nr:MAG: DnaJ domain-containing protein [Deltaproteobacteria bacterium]UCH08049.1 MAG: DnaJ domain-containing protein [Deltaproteobacteria bacterium]